MGWVSPRVRRGSVLLERHSPGQTVQAGSWKQLGLTSEMDCPALLSFLFLLKAGPALSSGEKARLASAPHSDAPCFPRQQPAFLPEPG